MGGGIKMLLRILKEILCYFANLAKYFYVIPRFILEKNSGLLQYDPNWQEWSRAREKI